MIYSKEEREKICENLDKIKKYLDYVRSGLREPVTIDFGPFKRYADFTNEQAYHITVNKDGINCRSGGLGFDFSKAEKSTFNATAYNQYDYAVALMQNWNVIKTKIEEAIRDQERMINAIHNFKI